MSENPDDSVSVFYIVRFSRAGRLTFYTGRKSLLISELWTEDRRKAARVVKSSAEATRLAGSIYHESSRTSVMAIMSEAFDSIITWGNNERVRQRRVYREQRKLEKQGKAAAILTQQVRRGRSADVRTVHIS